MPNINNTILDLDFTGVETSSLLPEGQHVVTVTGAEQSTSQAGNPMLVLTYTGAQTPGSLRQYLALTPNALWKAKLVFEALGLRPPQGRFQLPMNQLLGRFAIITVDRDGERLNITDTRPYDVAVVPPVISRNDFADAVAYSAAGFPGAVSHADPAGPTGTPGLSGASFRPTVATQPPSVATTSRTSPLSVPPSAPPAGTVPPWLQ